VCVLATIRPIEDEDPSLAELLADPATHAVRPTALTPAAAAELVRAALSAEADDEFCRACHAATGGNPLLLRELLRTLIAEDIVTAAPAALSALGKAAKKESASALISTPPAAATAPRKS
jgi:hypothetical protein